MLDSLEAIWPGLSSTAVAGTLLESWGLDLKRAKSERLARNLSSYNPQSFSPMPDVASDRLEFIEHIWRLFEPTSASHFDLLDKHLLRAMLSHQHGLVSPGEAKENGSIAKRYSELPSGVRSIASLDFLVGNAEPTEPQLLTLAKSTQLPAHAWEMLARGLLLLRVATAFTISNFNDAGVANGSGRFRPWIDPLAVSRGFWAPNAPLPDLADLWDDVKLALGDLVRVKNSATGLFVRLDNEDSYRAAYHFGSGAHRRLELGCMKYMGSKRAMLLNGLGKAIAEAIPRHKRFVDLFAGSGAVAWHVAQRYNVSVLACDLQEFSVALASGVICRKKKIHSAAFESWVARARQRAAAAVGFSKAVLLQQSIDIRNISGAAKIARTVCEDYSGGPVFAAYGGYYFSPLQAIYFDALRGELPSRGEDRDGLLATLIWTASRCPPPPGTLHSLLSQISLPENI